MNVRPVMRWGLMLPTQLSEFNVSVCVCVCVFVYVCALVLCCVIPQLVCLLVVEHVSMFSSSHTYMYM